MRRFSRAPFLPTLFHEDLPEALIFLLLQNKMNHLALQDDLQMPVGSGAQSAPEPDRRRQRII